MPHSGDIVVERLTGRRAIVIEAGDAEITCRFDDGRLEDRKAFEVEPAFSLPGWSLLSAMWASVTGRRDGRGQPPA